MKPEIFKDVHEGTIPMISDNGFINMELFINWLKHLNNCVKSTQDESVLLRLDSHFSHIRHEAVTLCRERDITLLSVTPPSSHKLQLLVGHLWQCVLLKVTKGCSTTLGLQFYKVIFAWFSKTLVEKLPTWRKQKKCFRLQDYSHLTLVFSDVDFSPSEVRNQLQGTRMRTQLVKLVSNFKCLCSLRRTQQGAIHTPIAPRINIHMRMVKGMWKE